MPIFAGKRIFPAKISSKRGSMMIPLTSLLSSLLGFILDSHQFFRQPILAYLLFSQSVLLREQNATTQKLFQFWTLRYLDIP